MLYVYLSIYLSWTKIILFKLRFCWLHECVSGAVSSRKPFIIFMLPSFLFIRQKLWGNMEVLNKWKMFTILLFCIDRNTDYVLIVLPKEPPLPAAIFVFVAFTLTSFYIKITKDTHLFLLPIFKETCNLNNEILFTKLEPILNHFRRENSRKSRSAGPDSKRFRWLSEAP